MIKVKNTDGTWSIVTGAGSASIIEKTYAELKALRDASKLIKGQLYRITDYYAFTTQETTQSANHPFDIIVQATSTNTLSEDAMAVLHDSDTYFASCNLDAWEIKYSLDVNTTKWFWASPSLEYASITVGGVVYSRDSSKDLVLNTSLYGDKTGYAFVSSSGDILRTESITAPTVAGDFKHYVDTSEGSTTTIDAYDSTNDTFYDSSYSYVTFKYTGDTFVVEGLTLYKMYSEEADQYMVADIDKTQAITYISSSIPFDIHNLDAKLDNQQTITAHTETPESAFRGVIYYMKDEWNNEAGFDFKGIQIKMQKVASASTVLTTSYNVSPTFVDEYVPYGITLLNYTLGTDTAFYYLFGDTTDGSIAGTYADNNLPASTTIPMINIRSNKASIGKNSDYIIILGLRSNIVGESCKNIAFSTDAKNNRIGEGCQNVVIESGCYGNAITGGSLYINMGKEAYKNTINNSFNIILGSGCYQNVFTGSCHRDYFTASSDNTFIACNDFTGLVTSHTNFCYNKFSNSDYVRINKDSVTTNTEVRNCTRASSSSVASIAVAFTGTTKYVTIDNCKTVGIGGTATNSTFINCTTAYVRTEATVSNTTAENSASIYFGEDGKTSTFSKVKVKDCENITLASTSMSESSVTNSDYVIANTGATITNSSIENCKCESTTPITINGSLTESKIINSTNTTVTAGCTVNKGNVSSSTGITLGYSDGTVITYNQVTLDNCLNTTLRSKVLIDLVTISNSNNILATSTSTLINSSIENCTNTDSELITISGTLDKSKILNSYTVNIAGVMVEATICNSDNITINEGFTLHCFELLNSYQIVIGDTSGTSSVTYYLTNIISSNNITILTAVLIEHFIINNCKYVTAVAGATIANSSLEDCQGDSSTYVTISATGLLARAKILSSAGITINGVLSQSAIENSYDINLRKNCTLTKCKILNCSNAISIGDETYTSATYNQMTLENCNNLYIQSANTVTNFNVINSNKVNVKSTAIVKNSSIKECRTDAGSWIDIGGTLDKSVIEGCYTVALNGSMKHSTVEGSYSVTISDNATLECGSVKGSDTVTIGNGTNTCIYYRTFVLNSTGVSMSGNSDYRQVTISGCAGFTLGNFCHLYCLNAMNVFTLTANPADETAKYEYWTINPGNYCNSTTTISSAAWESKILYYEHGIKQQYMTGIDMY